MMKKLLIVLGASMVLACSTAAFAGGVGQGNGRSIQAKEDGGATSSGGCTAMKKDSGSGTNVGG